MNRTKGAEITCSRYDLQEYAYAMLSTPMCIDRYIRYYLFIKYIFDIERCMQAICK